MTMGRLGRCAVLWGLAFAAFSAAAAEPAPSSVAEAIARGPSDQPVTLSAWAVRGELLDDVMDRYAAETRYNDPSSSERRLGARGVLADWRSDAAEARRVTVTGKVQRCGEVGGNLLAMIEAEADFCAKRRGLYLQIDRAEAGEGVPLIRGLAADAAGRGNLLPLSADSPVRAAVLAWFVEEIIGGLEALATNPAVEVFGWRKPLWADAEVESSWQQQGATAPEAIICVMEQSLAEQGLWPISTKDIGNAKGRPYLCAQIMSTGGKRRAVFAKDPSPAMEPR